MPADPAPPRQPLPPALATLQRNDAWTLTLCLGLVLLATQLQLTADGEGVRLLGRQLPESCATLLAFGLPCPGCGLTRSFVSLSQGDWLAGWRFHPLGPLLFALVLLQLPLRAWRLLWRWRCWRRGETPRESHALWLAWRWTAHGLIVALLAIGLGRVLGLLAWR